MVHEFTITPRVYHHIKDVNVLMDGVVNVVNEYTVEYMRGRTVFVSAEYDAGLMKLLPAVLDSGIPKSIRRHIQASLIRDEDRGTCQLVLDWDVSYIDMDQLNRSQATLQ